MGMLALGYCPSLAVSFFAETWSTVVGHPYLDRAQSLRPQAGSVLAYSSSGASTRHPPITSVTCNATTCSPAAGAFRLAGARRLASASTKTPGYACIGS